MTRLALVFLLASMTGLGQIRLEPNYCFGMLMAQANRKEIPAEEAQKIQAGHMAHLTALASKRWLVAAGPMMSPGNMRGFVISKCKSLDEAKEFANQDPAVRTGRLYIEAYRWQAPEGLGDRYQAEHAADPNAKMRMMKHPVAFLVKSIQWNGMPPMDKLKAHSEQTRSLMASGKIKTAGPFEDGGSKIGVLIFDVMPVEEARQLAESDPLVKAGLARVEMAEWLTADGTFPK